MGAVYGVALPYKRRTHIFFSLQEQHKIHHQQAEDPRKERQQITTTTLRFAEKNRPDTHAELLLTVYQTQEEERETCRTRQKKCEGRTDVDEGKRIRKHTRRHRRRCNKPKE